MRRLGDYIFEMRTKRLLDREIERLLAGAPVQDRDLALLSPVVEGLRTLAGNQPAETEVRSFAARAAVVVLERSHRPADAVASHRRRQKVGLTPRLAAMTMAVLLVPATAGAALAADSAIPGDPLYGLDRAFEVVGIGAGSTEERLTEAAQLAERGMSQQAIDHAILALGLNPNASNDAAREALEAVSDQLSSLDPSDVQALLAYIEANVGNGVGTDGREFGIGVTELARAIGAGPDNDPGQNSGQGQPGPSSTAPSDPPTDTPGQVQGPPEQPGNPAGQSGGGNEPQNGTDREQGGPADDAGSGNENPGPPNSVAPGPPNDKANAPPAEMPDEQPAADPVAPASGGDDSTDDQPNNEIGPPTDSPSVTAPGRQGPP